MPKVSEHSTAIAYSEGQIIQVAQLSQRDRAAGWVSYGQSERLQDL